MASPEELRDYYETNKDFRIYINKCMNTYNKSLDYMLKTKISESYYEYLKEKEKIEIHEDK